MPLPAPDLDDRRFQELVDEAKHMVQQRCPEWTDHNVSDPGVTLIELFAWMADQMVYRLNRVPDRNYVKFLELLGVRLFPATPARMGVTFWLSGEIEEPVTVPEGTQVSTPTSEFDDALVFRTTTDLVLPPCELVSVKVERLGERYDESGVLKGAAPFDAFQEAPEPGDALLLGLSDALPSCAVRFDLDCRVEGVGVDPDNPPLEWEAWDGEGWVACELEEDGTGGLNRQGGVVVHLPADHAVSILDRQRAGWVRCRVLEPEENQDFYTASPEIVSVSAKTVGGTAPSVHGVDVLDEIVGMSEGVPGQRFVLAHAPVIGGDGAMRVEVAAGDDWQLWDQVDDLSDRGPGDPVFMLDESSGELRFGPAVRLADGSLQQFGAIPPKGAPIRVPRYRTGGGSRGNVAPRTVIQLMSSIAFVDNRVVNRHAATGGVDVESMANARERGPILLRTRNRAVTAEDYEHLARAAAPEIARVRCVRVTEGDDAGAARVLVVPAVTTTDEELPFAALVPSDETLSRCAGYLDERRTIGARVVVEPPLYQGLTIVARLRARRTVNVQRLTDTAVAALHAYFHPTSGGPDGTGWPFGRPVHVGEVYAVLQGLDGTEFVEEALLFAADPITGERGEPSERIDLDPNALLFSYKHRVRVEA